MHEAGRGRAGGCELAGEGLGGCFWRGPETANLEEEGHYESEEAWPPSVLRVARVSRKPFPLFVPGCWVCSLRTVDGVLITAGRTLGRALPE